MIKALGKAKLTKLVGSMRQSGTELNKNFYFDEEVKD
jgi:hypothetical protein